MVYVDLWADPKRDPGDLIADAIAKAIRDNLGVVSKAAKAISLESVTVGGVMKIDTTRIGKPDGVTLTDALSLLHQLARQPIALIVDEAQHALTSTAGENAMSALKSARDQLNTPDTVRLMLVMSGSDRDKLLPLVNTTGAPFYGSQVQRMPPLGKDFVDFVVGLIEQQRPDLLPVNAIVLTEAFQLFGARPQFFAAALGDALSPLATHQGRFEDAVLAAALQRQRDDEAQMESEYLSLRPIETAQTVQTALENIRARTPALVWKSARGEYAVEDAMMNHWYAGRLNTGTWPPRPN